MDTAQRFAEFADVAERSGSSLYAAWARGVASDADLVALIDRARASQRQPVLVFAVSRLLGSGLGPFPSLRTWLLAHADRFVHELDRRSTQTNDVRRVAPVAAALTRIEAPVALLEVGASAGLCLYPDRYAVTVDGPSGSVVLGDARSAVRVRAVSRGMLVPTSARLPEIRFRAGLDLSPLDVRDDADLLWLETLLWPGQDERVALLRAAARIAAAEPTEVREGDAVGGLSEMVGLVHPTLTPVVVSTGSLVYLPGERRQAFVDEIARLGVRWISYEKSGSLGGIDATLPAAARERQHFATLALDGRAIATGDAHGTVLEAV
ncbi:DUF2332 domain-containing protein [Frondihabitans cladoniiphilus]|uniref:DUF2332 domain-containing protein n=1 Tax=Frondihabitans cladoniiphilus TaxID=715785 RepID=A0ABP8VV56_9MICO